MLAGTLCKKTLGAAAGSLVHITWMEYGPEAARALLSQVRQRAGGRSQRGRHACAAGRASSPLSLSALSSTCSPTSPPLRLPALHPPAAAQIQFTINHWLLEHGFSIGIGDLIADPRTMEIINDIMEKVGGVGGAGGGGAWVGDRRCGCRCWVDRLGAWVGL